MALHLPNQIGKRARIYRQAPRNRRRFGERILIRKEYWEREGWSENALLTFDRDATKDFAEKHGLRSPRTVLTLGNIASLPPLADLPASFVLKPLQGWSSNGVFLVRDGVEITTNEPISRTQIVRRVADLGSKIGEEFLVEELVDNWDERTGAPLDFKFYNFGRRTAYVDIVERNSLTNLRLNRHWFLDARLRPLGFKVQRNQDHTDTEPPLPPFADDLLAIAQRLAASLEMFVRVDLYASTEGPVMGELTANPHGGKGYTDFADLWLGSLWRGNTGA